MSAILCGPGDDEPDYDGLNSPTGRCSEHGDYLYFCRECADLATDGGETDRR